MSDTVFGFDGSASGDDDVVLAERRDGEWRIVMPEQEPMQLPEFGPPRRFEWSEEILTETAAGWLREHAAGEFEITDEQLEIMRATYAQLFREGKMTMWTNAPLHGHLERARAAR